jgi:hypothetical protein
MVDLLTVLLLLGGRLCLVHFGVPCCYQDSDTVVIQGNGKGGEKFMVNGENKAAC